MAKAIEFEVKIKGDSGVLKTLTIEATNADDAIGRIVESASRAGDALRRMAERSLVLDAGVRAIEKLDSVISGLAAPYNSFEAAMRGVNTMAGKNEEGLDRLTDSIKAIGREVPKTREELADGLYQVISNGVPEDNWIEFLDQSARASTGGIADLGQTVTVTSTIIKNYGLAWDAAGEIQNKIQMTAKNGVTSFEQLAQSLPRVTGSAAQLGVEVNELMATFATTTGVTGNTAEVSTQLAAVLNSLIKPTAEATKMADAMGIQFDAASIRAAGGFQNFLTQLDASVQDYAASSGQLSETIYGQLFGSAEALRLLGSLTGEQRDKFVENIGAMSDSAGTIDEAFSQMASTGDATNQTLKNMIQSWLDHAGAVASNVALYVELTANTGATILSLLQLKSMIGTVAGGIATWNIATKAAAVAQIAITSATKIWSIAQAALNAILTANPIGVVIMAVAALVAAIMLAYNQSEDFRRICDRLWAIIKKVAKLILDYYVWVFDMLSAVIRKAWELIKKFLGINDETPDSANTAASAVNNEAAALDNVADASEKAAKSGSILKKSVDWQKMSYEELGKAIESQKDKVAKLAGTGAASTAAEVRTLKQMEARYKALGRSSGLSDSSGEFDGKSLIANARSYKELGNNITYYQNQLEKTDPAERDRIARISQMIAALEKQQNAIKTLQEYYARPTEFHSLDDVDAAIAYNESLRGSASAEMIANIDAEIVALKAKRREMEGMSHIPLAPEEIDTYEKLESELSYYQDRLKYATVDARAEIQSQINALNHLKDSWDDLLAAMDAPGDISTLDTIDKLDKAISYCNARMKRANADEAAGIERARLAYEEKRRTMERGVTVARSAADITRLSMLSGMRLKIELDLIGLDGVKKKIRELKDMLADTRYPLTQKQRKDTQDQIDAWEKYERQLMKSNLRFKDAWGGITGVDGGMRSLTETLRGDGTAWEKMMGAVNAAISVYESARKVITMVDMVSRILGVTKKAEAASTDAGTAATAGNTVALGANTAASGVNTATKSGEAIANATASGAKLPFPLNIAAIAAGVAAVMGALKLVGAFATGGIVGGNSPTGDRLLARVNSGEMILNTAQQTRLFNMLNMGAISMPHYAGGILRPAGITGLIGPAQVAIPNGELRLVARGRDMYGIIRTEQLIRSRR